MKVDLHQLSVQGGRDDNEDRLGYCRSASALLLVLADGMGGYNAGELAAEIAVRVFTDTFAALAQPQIEQPALFLQQTLLRANRAIVDHARSAGMREQPRTTLVAALLQQGQLWAIHAGDSRLYWLRPHAPWARTRDHTHQDQPSLSGAPQVPQRNLLFSCLGLEGKPLFDTLGPSPLQPGDRLLLCSDGLWSVFDDAELAHTFLHTELGAAVPEAVQTALERAGAMSDNISVLALEWEPPAARAAAATLANAPADADAFDPASLERALDEVHAALARSQRTLARKP